MVFWQRQQHNKAQYYLLFHRSPPACNRQKMIHQASVIRTANAPLRVSYVMAFRNLHGLMKFGVNRSAQHRASFTELTVIDLN